MTGAWIFICGASGAGKDSVIAWARQALAERSDIVFARRMVTRPLQHGSEHDPVSDDEFQSLLQAGGLCWHWQAHGFHYGIERRYAADLQAGRLVVINGSRDHAQGLPRSAGLRLVQVTAPSEQLARRLAQRGRDTEDAVAERLARNTHFSTLKADCLIVNDGALATAGQRLASYLGNSSTLASSRMPR